MSINIGEAQRQQEAVSLLLPFLTGVELAHDRQRQDTNSHVDSLISVSIGAEEDRFIPSPQKLGRSKSQKRP